MDQRSTAEPPEDDDMVAEFSARSAGGLERVYAVYGRRLYAVARGVLGDPDDAQDCVHDTLLRIWQQADRYRRERGSLRSYLLVAVRNDALTRKRAAGRHSDIERRAARGSSPAYELEPSDPIERIRLRRALAALPPDQKIALELTFFGQLTHVQVARHLDIPLGTIKSRIALALRKLHAALAAGPQAR